MLQRIQIILTIDPGAADGLALGQAVHGFTATSMTTLRMKQRVQALDAKNI